MRPGTNGLKTAAAGWKHGPVRLKQRFDLDRNGVIDPREWEPARRTTRQTAVQQRRQLHAQTDVQMLRAPRNWRLSLISSLSLQSLRHRYLR